MTNKEIVKIATRTPDFVNSIGMEFRLIQAGSFMMGSENGRMWEAPVHKVTITKPFYIGIYEVTQSQYKAIMRTNPSNFRGDDRPVEMVTWDDAKEFCRKLSEKEGRTYRLPTEAEWEYACRAGTTTEYYWGDRPDEAYLWHDGNSGNRTHPVGEKLPNAWGLYDMLGNVYEWCEDWYSSSYYSSSPEIDPAGPSSGSCCALRGGCWFLSAFYARSSTRNYRTRDRWGYCVGFRAVMEADNEYQNNKIYS